MVGLTCTARKSDDLAGFKKGWQETPESVYNFTAVVQSATNYQKMRRESKYGSKPENQNQVKGL